MPGGGVIIVDEDSGAPGAAVVGPANLDSGAEPAKPRLQVQLQVCDDHCCCCCCCRTCGDGSLDAASARSVEALNTDGMREVEGRDTFLFCRREKMAISNWQAWPAAHTEKEGGRAPRSDCLLVSRVERGEDLLPRSTLLLQQSNSPAYFPGNSAAAVAGPPPQTNQPFKRALKYSSPKTTTQCLHV